MATKKQVSGWIWFIRILFTILIPLTGLLFLIHNILMDYGTEWFKYTKVYSIVALSFIAYSIFTGVKIWKKDENGLLHARIYLIAEIILIPIFSAIIMYRTGLISIDDAFLNAVQTFGSSIIRFIILMYLVSNKKIKELYES